MIRRKFAQTLILGTCITVLSAGTAFASTGEVQLPKELVMEEVNMTAPVDSGDALLSFAVESAPDYDSDVLERQSEIDKLVFEQYKDEIAEKGITVTHTGPNMDGYVEVGISPYSQENADYLLKITGSDMVKIVEGQQAVALGVDAASSAAAETTAMDAVSDSAVKASAAAANTPKTLFYAFGAAVLLGAVVLIKKLAMSVK